MSTVRRAEDGAGEVISPDLTTNDKSRQQISGGLTPDNVGVEYGSVLFAIAESPVERGVIWAGTNDGLVQLTRDGGGNWTDVTPNIPDLPEWGTVSNIEPSRYEAGKAYITVDLASGEQPGPLHLQDHRLRPELEAHHQRDSEQRFSATPTASGRIRSGRDSSTWGPRTPSTLPSTTERAGYRFRRTSPTPPCTGW